MSATYYYLDSDFRDVVSYNMINMIDINYNLTHHLDLGDAVSYGAANVPDYDNWPYINHYLFYFDRPLSDDALAVLNDFIATYTYTVQNSDVCFFKDIKSIGTNAGTFTSGVWQTRCLNHTEGAVNFVTIKRNQIIFNRPGDYSITARAPSVNVLRNQVKIRNITDGIDYIGTNAYSGDLTTGSYAMGGIGIANGVISTSEASCLVTLVKKTVFEIQHRCEQTCLSIGLGKACGFGDEVYTTVAIKILARA